MSLLEAIKNIPDYSDDLKDGSTLVIFLSRDDKGFYEVSLLLSKEQVETLNTQNIKKIYKGVKFAKHRNNRKKTLPTPDTIIIANQNGFNFIKYDG